jgi:hypothetical protein
MATEYSRIIHKRTSVPGLAPTVPISDNLNDFIGTDIYEGELFYNITDQKLYTRSNSEIVLLNPTKTLIIEIGPWNMSGGKSLSYPEIDASRVVSMSLAVVGDDEDTWFTNQPDLYVSSFDSTSAQLVARRDFASNTRTDINRGYLKIEIRR